MFQVSTVPPPPRGPRTGIVVVGAVAILAASLLTLWPPPGFEGAAPSGGIFDEPAPPAEPPSGSEPASSRASEHTAVSGNEPAPNERSAVTSPAAAPTPPSGHENPPGAEGTSAASPAPSSVAPTQPQPSASADAFERGRKLEAQGKRRQAQSLFESTAEHEAPHSPLLSHLAYLYLNQGKNVDAASFAARAVQTDPTNSEGWIVLGAAKSELGERNAARDAYRNCAQQGRGSYVSECRRMLR
ncbi:MAG: hypothetical protein ABW321_31285 [Polyangiales bacterium]